MSLTFTSRAVRSQEKGTSVHDRNKKISQPKGCYSSVNYVKLSTKCEGEIGLVGGLRKEEKT